MGSYVPAPYDCPKLKVGTVDDGKDLLIQAIAPSDALIVLRTWVCADTPTAVPVTLSKDDCAAVWLNGAKVNGAALGADVAVSLAFPSGRSALEYAL